MKLYQLPEDESIKKQQTVFSHIIICSCLIEHFAHLPRDGGGLDYARLISERRYPCEEMRAYGDLYTACKMVFAAFNYRDVHSESVVHRAHKLVREHDRNVGFLTVEHLEH